MIGDIIVIILLLLAAVYWLEAQKIKEIALAATYRYCQRVEVQMLDAYIALSHMDFSRNDSGRLQLNRTFSFEFSSTGYDRYAGQVVMQGRKVKSIVMEPYPLQ
jgi:Protein of unknown function (DUF3301)